MNQHEAERLAQRYEYEACGGCGELDKKTCEQCDECIECCTARTINPCKQEHT